LNLNCSLQHGWIVLSLLIEMNACAKWLFFSSCCRLRVICPKLTRGCFIHTSVFLCHLHHSPVNRTSLSCCLSRGCAWIAFIVPPFFLLLPLPLDTQVRPLVDLFFVTLQSAMHWVDFFFLPFFTFLSYFLFFYLSDCTFRFFFLV